MANQERLLLKISGMHCASCVANVEKGLSRLDGVTSARVNLVLNSAVVEYDRQRLSEASIINTVNDLGYVAEAGEPDILTANEEELLKARNRFRVAATLALPLMLFAMLPMAMRAHAHLISAEMDAVIQAALATAILVWAGRTILADAWMQTRHMRANMNSLIAMGTLAAFLWSLYATIRILEGEREELYFDSAGMIIALILLGKYLEARSKGRAGQAIRALLKLKPTKTTAVFNKVEFEVDAETVRPGMFLLIKPGERIAADGIIIEGRPTLDESMLTGESMPIERREGDSVVGGSLNVNVPFKMKVTAAGEKSYLATIVRMVTDAQSRKAPIQALADRVAGVFVPIVIGIALVTLAIWYFAAPESPMMLRSVISVLIIACPCALGLATPTAVLAGTGRAARAGILIRGGDILEKLAHIDAVLFDKTGTLTRGKLEVVSLKSLGGFSESQLKAYLNAVERRSEHPIARAIATATAGSGGDEIPVTDIIAKPGFGMSAQVLGKSLLIGSRDLLDSEGVDLGDTAQPLNDHRSNSQTAVLISFDRKLVGMVALADQVRPEAAEVVGMLRATHRTVTMISGDNRVVAGTIASQVGLESFEAEVRPDQKQALVASYRDKGHCVAMVGDGINDAPALAAADVGIAIGEGTDIAIETADVILLRSDLRTLPQAFRLARISIRVIRQNLFWAFFYNVLAIPIAAGLLYPVVGWTLSPMIAAAAMSFSSLFVVLNSLRLSRLTV
jgi:P-type Cu+ transporter